MLLQVIKSWQVITVTVAVILYISLVSYVARTYHRPRVSKYKPAVSRKKAAAMIAAAVPEEVPSTGSNTNEELGLEEAES